MTPYRHNEAFALMWYECRCGHRERIWNSRDGVTPFGGIECPSCNDRSMEAGLKHVDWHLDHTKPDHVLAVGQRYFRNGTADDAVLIIQRRIERFQTIGKPIPAEIAAHLLSDAREQTGEWRKGWPKVDRWGSAPVSDTGGAGRPTAPKADVGGEA